MQNSAVPTVGFQKWNDVCLELRKVSLLFLLCRASQRLDQCAGQTDGPSSLLRREGFYCQTQILSLGVPDSPWVLTFVRCLSSIYLSGCVGSWLRHMGSFVMMHGLLSSCGMGVH